MDLGSPYSSSDTTIDPARDIAHPMNYNQPTLGDDNPQCSYVGQDYTDYYNEYYIGGTNPSPGCTLS
jgi:hypothetical protein